MYTIQHNVEAQIIRFKSTSMLNADSMQPPHTDRVHIVELHGLYALSASIIRSSEQVCMALSFFTLFGTILPASDHQPLLRESLLVQ